MSKQNPITRSKKKKAQGLFQANHLPEARELLRQVCQLDRLDADAWFTLGLVNAHMGLMRDVIACCQEVIAIRPDFAEAHFNLAKAFQEIGLLQEAEQGYRRALNIKPQWPEALNNLGNVIQELGNLEEAKSSYTQALTLRTDYVEALVNLGNVLKLQGRAAEAAHNYRRVLELNPTHVAAYKALGGALVMLGQLDDALDCYRKIAQIDPADIDVIAAEAVILERRGLIDEAYAKLKPFIDNGAANLEIANAFALLCDRLGRCDEAILLLEKSLAKESAAVSWQKRIVAHFNLGRLYDLKSDYDRAFLNYKTGNDLKPHRFDGERFIRFVDDLIDTFNGDFLRSAPRATHGSQRPVFIVGMPRSGTSLVEQILSSHPQVFGGGELEDIKNISLGVSDTLGSSLPYPQCVSGLTESACNQLAQAYLHGLEQLSPDARYVTDKMPQNFLGLGLISLLFPEARVIHCMRGPLDTCLSCYFHDFGGFNPFIYRLENLSLYYRQYQRLMHHWQKVLSLPILNVSYEAVVEDQVGMTRKILDFCGLEWDERCLRFYENDRIVYTSSYNQVRKPMYKDSVGRWRHYEIYLEPLKKTLSAP